MLVVSHDPAVGAVADRIVHIRDGRVAARQCASAGVPEEIVVGRGGWLRLPEELLRRAGIGARASARLERDEIVVLAAGEAAQERAAAEVRRRRPAPPGASSPSCAASRRATGAAPSSRARRDVRGRDAHRRHRPVRLGKTTLLHLLAGLELPDAGEVVVLGATVVSARPRRAAPAPPRARSRFVGQEPGLVPFLSARENVELGLALHGTRSATAPSQALAAVGLAERADQRVVAALDRRARARRDRPRARRQPPPPARGRADRAARPGERALGRRPASPGSPARRASPSSAPRTTRLLIEQADEQLRLG